MLALRRLAAASRLTACAGEKARVGCVLARRFSSDETRDLRVELLKDDHQGEWAEHVGLYVLYVRPPRHVERGRALQ